MGSSNGISGFTEAGASLKLKAFIPLFRSSVLKRS